MGRESPTPTQPTAQFRLQPFLKGEAISLSGKSTGPWPSLVDWGVLLSHAESPVCREHQAPSGTLKEALSQLQSISSYFQAQDQAAQQEVGWLTLLERVDRLLFQGYLVMLGLYAITLCSLWALWSRL